MNNYGRPRTAQAKAGEWGASGAAASGSTDLANENNGVSGVTTPTGAAASQFRAAFDELPYFQEYLQSVLRPKIEKTIETLDRLLTEAAWRHIVATVAADQHIPADAANSIIRPLLEQKLGLKMQVKLDSSFATPAPAPPPVPPVDMGEGVTRPGVDGPEVLTVRRRPLNNPMANAVANNSRPLGR
jgi:hypothetical protein